MAGPADSSSAGSWRRDLLWLTVAFAALFFFRLGGYPLNNPDEGRNAEIPREMVASGDWVTPRLNGVNYFEKPPLVYWTTALALKAFGPAEWAMRSTPALTALLGVLITYGAGRRLYGRKTGLAAALVLGTSLFYFIMAHVLVLDMAVSVFMSATLFCFILGVREPAGSGSRRWFFYGLYASAALATLTKGLIGFLVTGAVMFLWLLVFNEWKRLRPLFLPSGVLLFLAIAVPWHVLAAQHNPTWFHRYIVFEHFERFLTPVASRPGPLWYFVPIVLAGLFPWVGFLAGAVRTSFAGGWGSRKTSAEAWFLLTWIGFVFLFFSVSKSKLPPYILPVFPPLAVLLGRAIAPVFETGTAAGFRTGLRVFVGFCLVLTGAFLLVVFRPHLAKLAPDAAAQLRIPALSLAVVLLAGAVLTAWLAAKRGQRIAIAAIAGTLALFYVVLQHANLPQVIKPGTRSLALEVKRLAHPGDRVMHYHEFFHDFTFYAERVVDVVAYKGELELEEDPAAQSSGRFIDEPTFRALWTGPGRLFVVARKRDVEPRATERTLFGDPGFHCHILAETPNHYLFSNQP
jgi:4-amino-4-deoxy-L-arabinose transferase-like glycosyltransferase